MKKTSWLIVVLVFFSVSMVYAQDSKTAETAVKKELKMKKIFYVAVDGNDGNPGSFEQPFASLDAAKNAVRGAVAAGNPVDVILKPGKYPLKQTFQMTSSDSGTADAPVAYRAEKNGTVCFYGGASLSNRKPVTDSAVLRRLPEESRGKVWQCDLKAEGVTDFGFLKERGCIQLLPSREISAVEFYCGGKRMELSRYPKKEFLRPKRLVQPGVYGKETSVLEYDSPRHERWVNAEDLWLFGYFRWQWADAQIKVAKIDTVNKQIIMDHAYCYSADAPMDDTQGILYKAFNLLEELSEPGEWYLNRNTGILYFIPPEGTDPETAALEIGMTDMPLVKMDHASFITLKNLDFDLGRDSGIVMNDCSDCVLEGCSVTRFGVSGIKAVKSTRCRIADCELAWFGRDGMMVSGGDRHTLTSGENVIENNKIHDLGCVDHTYVPCLNVEGVGCRIAHNLLYNCPSSVLRLEGNDHIFEYNEVHSAVLESDDQGAVDIYLNPTYRGNVFRYNYFHDIGHRVSAGDCCGEAGIRLDDIISGTVITGNIFQRIRGGRGFGAVQMNCGRDNRIEKNLFLDCGCAVSGGYNPNHHVLLELAEDAVSAGKPEYVPSPDVRRLKQEEYGNPLYAERYPALANLLDGKGKNTFVKNVISGCKSIFNHHHEEEQPAYYESADNLFIRKLNQSVKDAVAEGVRAGILEDLSVENMGIITHDGCAWTGRKIISAYTEPVQSWEKNPAPGEMKVYSDCVFSSEWKIFGPFIGENANPMPKTLSACPDSIQWNGKTYYPQTGRAPDGSCDAAEFSKDKKIHEVYWIYVPFHCPKSGKVTIGCGFDYWGTVWIDGVQVFATGELGNIYGVPNPYDHLVPVELQAGSHVMTVRLESGASTKATLSLGSGKDLQEKISNEWWWVNPVSAE